MGKMVRVIMLIACCAMLVPCMTGCPSLEPEGRKSVNITGELNVAYAAYHRWPLEEQTVIDWPTRFNLTVYTSEPVDVSSPPSNDDDVRAVIEVRDPFGDRPTRYLPMTLRWVASKTYQGSLSKTMLEYIGTGGQLGPAQWTIYIEKGDDITLTFTCDVSYIPYSG